MIVEYVQARQTCGRCGHTSVECDRCERTDLLLGGTVGVAYYCHTFSPSRPTCFEQAVREAARDR